MQLSKVSLSEQRAGWVKKSVLCRFSYVQLFVTAWTVAHQAFLSMGFPRQEYWSGLPCPPPGDLPNPRIKPTSPALQGDSWPMTHQWSLEGRSRGWPMQKSQSSGAEMSELGRCCWCVIEKRKMVIRGKGTDFWDSTLYFPWVKYPRPALVHYLYQE